MEDTWKSFWINEPVNDKNTDCKWNWIYLFRAMDSKVDLRAPVPKTLKCTMD
jgi:hypothetical protein